MENDEAVIALGALAQATRLETFRLLIKNEPTGIPAGELARIVGVPQNTMSAHLAILARAKLVKGERHSRSIIYRANIRAFQDLAVFMIQDCCNGRPDLCTSVIESIQRCCFPEKKAKAAAASPTPKLVAKFVAVGAPDHIPNGSAKDLFSR